MTPMLMTMFLEVTMLNNTAEALMYMSDEAPRRDK